MKDHLLRYAIDNIWCNPRQDKQYSYKLSRLTPIEGARVSYVVEKERYQLPTVGTADIWHLYQIGQVVPNLIGMPTTRNKWIPLTVLLEEYLLDCEVYVTSGVLFSRNETFVMITETKNLLVAIRDNKRFPDLMNDTVGSNVYLHLYSNAFFRSTRAVGRRFMHVLTKVATTLEDVRQFQIQSMDLAANKGVPGKAFVNGRLVNEISVSSADVGDYLEFIIDGAYKKTLFFDIADLPTFASSLDNVGKYILHYPGITNTIDYLDDLDIYLVKKRSNNPNLYSGVCYHRSNGIWVRMLTHKDYSVPVGTIEALAAEHPEDTRYLGPEGKWPSDLWNDIESLTLKVIVRHGGYERPLIKDVSRTEELYKLSSDNIVRAMTGADSVANCWLAANLEKSKYVGFMGLTDIKVIPKGYGFDDKVYPDKEYITDYAAKALGYHAAAKLLSNGPLKVITDPDGNYVDLSYNHWEDTTMFEYNEAGELLGHYHHVFGERYRSFNADCYIVEPVIGKGSMQISGFYGKRSVVIPKGHTFRLYVSPIVHLSEGRKWEDITESPDLARFGFFDRTDFNKQKWVWTHDEMQYEVYLRTDELFYLKEMQLNKSSGMLRFAIDAFEDIGGELVNRLLEIPFGQLDVFLNGKPIIEDIDFVSGDLRTVINNLEHLIDGVNTVIIRGTGFCDADIKRYKPSEIGFIEYGVVSSNGRYGLHHNRVQRISADGKLLHSDDVIFDEALSEYRMENVRNGSPYQIQSPQTTFREIFADDFVARKADDLIDEEVSNYLTYYLPKRERLLVDSIDRKYKVFSAASNLILHLILDKKLVPPIENGRFDELKAQELIKPYEWIKRLDIVNTNYNKNHMFVYPHWFDEAIGLTWFEYKLYTYLLKMFLKEPIDISTFVYILRTQ